jgi:hypothetical protein
MLALYGMTAYTIYGGIEGRTIIISGLNNCNIDVYIHNTNDSATPEHAASRTEGGTRGESRKLHREW